MRKTYFDSITSMNEVAESRKQDKELTVTSMSVHCNCNKYCAGYKIFDSEWFDVLEELIFCPDCYNKYNTKSTLKKIKIETSLGIATGTVTDNKLTFTDPSDPFGKTSFTGFEVIFDDGPSYPGYLFDFSKAILLDNGWIKIKLADSYYGFPEYKCI